MLEYLQQLRSTYYAVTDAARDEAVLPVIEQNPEIAHCLYKGDTGIRLTRYAPYLFQIDLDIRQRHPQRQDDDETLRRKIRVGIGRARKNDLHTDDQLWEYVRIMFETSPNFDQEPRIRAMLDDKSLSIDDRWEALFETRFDDAWNATDEPAFYNPTYWYEEEDDNWSPTPPSREDLAYMAAWLHNQKTDPSRVAHDPGVGQSRPGTGATDPEPGKGIPRAQVRDGSGGAFGSGYNRSYTDHRHDQCRDQFCSWRCGGRVDRSCLRMDTLRWGFPQRPQGRQGGG
jgi:hypothetical protein